MSKDSVKQQQAEGGAVAKVLMTVKLGTHSSPDALHKALKAGGFNVVDDPTTDDILGKIVVSPTEMELDLVVVAVPELGLRKWELTTYDELYRRVKELDLELCPPEVGPQLCLQYQDRQDELFVIGMEPISDFVGDLQVFFVACHEGYRWLGTATCNSIYKWIPTFQVVWPWVLVRRK